MWTWFCKRFRPFIICTAWTFQIIQRPWLSNVLDLYWKFLTFSESPTFLTVSERLIRVSELFWSLLVLSFKVKKGQKPSWNVQERSCKRSGTVNGGNAEWSVFTFNTYRDSFDSYTETHYCLQSSYVKNCRPQSPLIRKRPRWLRNYKEQIETRINLMFCEFKFHSFIMEKVIY